MLEKEEKYDFFEITNSKHPALYAPESPVWLSMNLLEIAMKAADSTILNGTVPVLYFKRKPLKSIGVKNEEL